MSITLEQFNPIGYKSQTPEGKNYTKSNIGKTAAITGVTAFDIFIYNSKYKNQFNIKSVLQNDFKINIPNKYLKPLEILGFAIDIAVAYGIGSWIDKQINKHRIKN